MHDLVISKAADPWLAHSNRLDLVPVLPIEARRLVVQRSQVLVVVVRWLLCKAFRRLVACCIQSAGFQILCPAQSISSPPQEEQGQESKDCNSSHHSNHDTCYCSPGNSWRAWALRLWDCTSYIRVMHSFADQRSSCFCSAIAIGGHSYIPMTQCNRLVESAICWNNLPSVGTLIQIIG